MLPSFPRKASVDASLKSDKERVQIKQYLEAKRRDDGDAKKKCGVIGWEIVEALKKMASSESFGSHMMARIFI